MNNSVCTLFEGHYHFGLGALVNSLYKSGFRGDIYAGYRGSIPKWASYAYLNEQLLWQNAQTLSVCNELNIHFLPLDTDYHLTNFKPDFMLKLFEKFQLASLFYFDPDIVLKVHWEKMMEWLNIGVCLCEDINSPLLEFHPRRVYWRRYYEPKNLELVFKSAAYVNGGFIGIKKESIGFLTLWKNVQMIMAEQIGGLSKSSINYKSLDVKEFGEFGCFNKTDQDALNISIEAYSDQVSILGKEAMGFANSGEIFMYHALGSPKPWNENFFKSFISGNKPSDSSKEYWNYVTHPIQVYSPIFYKRKRISIIICTFLSRFYKK